MSKRNERETIAVTAKVRDQFGWFKDATEEIAEAAIKREASARSSPKTRLSKIIARRFRTRIQSLRVLQERCEVDKAALTRMWAQHGASSLEGLTIRPGVALSLDETALIDALPVDVRKDVVEERPHLLLSDLLSLARHDEKLRSLILKHVSAKATVSVTAPKD